ISAGGPTATMWTDDGSVQGCSPANAPIGLRWISSARNGTAGVGVWGGNFSRLAYFAFEITGLDTNATDLRPASPTRAAILDATFRWLVSSAASGLDRDHPDVALTAPNGGVFQGPSIPIASPASASGPGVRTVTFAATADDRARGGSDIAAAELFLQTAQPPAGANGQGLPMSPSDGRFDGTVEAVSWADALPAPPGTACVWIHAQDAAGNWGPYGSKCFVVINAGPDTVPPAPAIPDAVFRVNGNLDLSIGWRASFDDGLFGGTTQD